ncbi:restriction endonuclease subunit S [Mesotoga sp. UBA5557]|jgi:type I restriction enzyme S subunit|uniref:restriction endonuclease subunit S n=1 Tax=Mesotoga sp. UBA5557 TaxID=1946857 RepID=UPI0025D0C79E|nr:restriction endonuclease subunit S [Mesotoga sp. UBA5557]
MSEEITKDLEKIAPKRWKRYPRYKDSGVEWIGEIPTNWRVYRLKELAKINPSKTEKNHLPDDLEVSFVPMESIGEYGGISGAEAKKLLDVKQGYTYFAEGDLIVAKITPCFENYKGAIASDLVNGIGFGTTELFVLRPNERSDSRYLFYVSISKAFRETGSKIMHGAAGQKRITVDFINNYPVALPKPEEQSQIVGFLDETLKRVDSLITKKQRLIELLKEKRAVIISRAVTKGLDPNAPMKDSGIEWVGKMPQEWDLVRFKHTARMKYGSSLPSELRNDGDFLVYGSNGPVGMNSCANTSAPVVVLGRKGSFGKVNYSDKPVFAIDTTYYIDKSCTDSHMKWLFYLLQVLDLDSVSMDTGVPGLSREHVHELIIPNCGYAEQRRISVFLDNVTSKLDSFISKIEKSIELLKEYRSALITAAVTGKIDVREEVP